MAMRAVILTAQSKNTICIPILQAWISTTNNTACDISHPTRGCLPPSFARALDNYSNVPDTLFPFPATDRAARPTFSHEGPARSRPARSDWCKIGFATAQDRHLADKQNGSDRTCDTARWAEITASILVHRSPAERGVLVRTLSVLYWHFWLSMRASGGSARGVGQGR